MAGLSGFPEAEQRAAFLLRLRAAGVRDLQVLRAMEFVPRTAFFPDAEPADTLRDIALPLPHGQAAERPSSVALGLAALALREGLQVLEVGSGSGYVTALLVRIGARVTALERRQRLADAAKARLVALGLAPDALLWADGTVLPDSPARYARMVIHLALRSPPAQLLDRLEEDGRLLYTSADPPRRLMLARRSSGGLMQEDIGPSTATAAGEGLVQ